MRILKMLFMVIMLCGCYLGGGYLLKNNNYTTTTKITEIIKDPIFENYGRLMFPLEDWYYSGTTLGNIRLTWYNNISSNKTVEVMNYFKNSVENKETIFFDIYTEEEKRKDSSKKDTGLFYFKGNPKQPFAICNAGGGFSYVGAIHDSFPHALEISKHGYHGFALIYRPNPNLACEDLARAIQFIFENAKQLQIDTNHYSLWGGSAGARMAAWMGTYGTDYFIDKAYPKPSAVIMQYTGHQQYSPNDPATFAVCGENDWIANDQTMKKRLDIMKRLGIDTEFYSYPGLSHGFGLGIGTVAEGWIEKAILFWERQMK